MERITDPTANTSVGHVFRYQLVTAFLRPEDKVLDAACGIGYGENILRNVEFDMYWGVDIIDPDDIVDFRSLHSSRYDKVDLTERIPVCEPDIAIGYETLEHLENYKRYIQTLKQAGRLIFMSVPIVPSKHVNHYHVHDFEFEDVVNLMVDDDWILYQALQQPSEVSGIYIFNRKGFDV